MGKNRKGKELGKGLAQRKDGRYSARFVNSFGKRIEKYFDTLPEARNWLEDARYEDKHSTAPISSDISVEDWFELWVKSNTTGWSPNTTRNKVERFEQNIKPIIGNMKIGNVKKMHCQKVLDEMEPLYAGSTIAQTYITMGAMFRDAIRNDVISKHPMDNVDPTKPPKAPDKINYMTIAQQEAFLEAISSSHYCKQYTLLLQTGLRIGELIALTWDDIDFEKRTLTVCKTMCYLYNEKRWFVRQPKTRTSYRTIPLTQRAYDILCDAFKERNSRKQSKAMSRVEYLDIMSGKTKTLDIQDLVFLNWKTGEPVKASTYDTCMYGMCEKAGIPKFSVHDLRHTFATRAIEREVNPKVLQRLLGHSSLKMTMDRYVHTTVDSLEEGVRQFEKGEKLA